jgi:CBS-domain-containing membrane protein
VKLKVINALAFLLFFLLLGCLANYSNQPLLLGSFGASAALLFAYPSAAFAKYKNAILAHFISAIIALLFLYFLGYNWWSLAICLAITYLIIDGFNLMHPPACGNPIIIMMSHASWAFLIYPLAIGLILLLAFAILLNYIKTRYTSVK